MSGRDIDIQVAGIIYATRAIRESLFIIAL